MKKLTKKSLDKLAERMPVVSESEQQYLIRGSFYFDHSGNFVGQYAAGNDIIIANSILHSGTPFSLASDATINAILTTMASAMGISGGIGAIRTGDNRYAEFDPETGKISFNLNSELLSSNNYYDYLSVLHHEHYHQMTMGYSGSWLQNEYQALIYQIDDSSFQYASDWLRDYTMTNYYNLHYGQSYY